MARIWEMKTDGAPATWMDDADDFKEQPGDAADANRPDIYSYENVQWVTGGLSPNSATGLDITTADGTDWSSTAALFSDIGNAHVSAGSVPGQVWNAQSFGFRARYYIDAGVKSEAGGTLFPVQIISADSRSTIGFLSVATYLEFYDWDTVEAYLETLDGTFSDPILWADIIDKLVEFDAQWVAASPSSGDGTLTVSLRTSTDGTSWTDLGVVLTETNHFDYWDYRVSTVPYGMTVALGYAGMPGQCQYAELYDSGGPEDDVPGEYPQDYSTGCCSGDAAPGTSSTGTTSGDPTRSLQPWTVQCDGGGTVPSESDPSAAEAWA